MAIQKMAEVLDFLSSYVVEHFGAEENAMKTANYPPLVQHRQLHHAFLTDFVALRKRYEQGGASVSLTLEVQRRVVDWLMNHIRKEDKAFGAFLKKSPATAMA